MKKWLWAAPAVLYALAANGAELEFINDLATGRTRVELLATKGWPETVMVDMQPRSNLLWSDRSWPVVLVLEPGERQQLGQLQTKPGEQISGHTSSRAGSFRARTDTTVRYADPLAGQRDFQEGEYQYRNSQGSQPVVAAREGIVAEVSESNAEGVAQLNVVHADGSLGRYRGVSSDMRPGRLVQAGQEIGKTVPGWLFSFGVFRPSGRFVPNESLESLGAVQWASGEAMPGMALETMAEQPALNGLPQIPSEPSRFSGMGKWLLVGGLLYAVVYWWLYGRKSRSARRSYRSVAESWYRRAKPGRIQQEHPHLDAYARLLRAVHGDVSRADALVAYEIRRGATPHMAPLNALDRLIRDRGY